MTILHRFATPARLGHASTKRGATMIEVLVALVIFAFGVLGLAGMQARALSYSQGALYRSQATALADDMFDRMRADRVKALAGSYDTALTDPASTYSASATNLYEVELNNWKDTVETLLPAGKASVARDATGALFTVTITWDESRAARSSGSTTSLKTVSRL
jgi:type IV pilus assembly protein PilV